jgi:anti-anti-sigma regulatory factor
VFETVELSRRRAHEFDDDTIDAAIELLTTFTRSERTTDEAIDLLIGLRQTAPNPRRVNVAGIESPAARSTLSIVTIEGRGIWIELTGALVDEACDLVAERLAQLRNLDFAAAVVDLRQVTALDQVGLRCVVDFAEPITEAGGTVHIVDPDSRLRDAGDVGRCGIVHIAEPPADDWWR